MNKSGFCIFIDTVCDGPTPSLRSESGEPCVFRTQIDAQREIADNLMTRLQEFMDGEREFEDALTLEEYVMPVEILADGAVVDTNGNCYTR